MVQRLRWCPTHRRHGWRCSAPRVWLCVARRLKEGVPCAAARIGHVGVRVRHRVHRRDDGEARVDGDARVGQDGHGAHPEALVQRRDARDVQHRPARCRTRELFEEDAARCRQLREAGRLLGAARAALEPVRADAQKGAVRGRRSCRCCCWRDGWDVHVGALVHAAVARRQGALHGKRALHLRCQHLGAVAPLADRGVRHVAAACGTAPCDDEVRERRPTVLVRLVHATLHARRGAGGSPDAAEAGRSEHSLVGWHARASRPAVDGQRLGRASQAQVAGREAGAQRGQRVHCSA